MHLGFCECLSRSNDEQMKRKLLLQLPLHSLKPRRLYRALPQDGYNFSQSRAVEVHTEAQDLIAMLPKDALTKTMIRQAIDALNAVSKSLECLKTEMRDLASQLPEYPVVMDMYGVGDSLGPQLMAEIRYDPLHP